MSNPDDTQPSPPEASPPPRPEASPPPRPEASPPYQPMYPRLAPAAACAPPPRLLPPRRPLLRRSPRRAPRPFRWRRPLPPGSRRGRSCASERESRRRTLGALAVACFLTLAAVFGYSIGSNHGSNSTSASSNFPTQQQIPRTTRAIGSNGARSNGQQANIDVQSIAAKVSPSVVNLVSAVQRW